MHIVLRSIGVLVALVLLSFPAWAESNDSVDPFESEIRFDEVWHGDLDGIIERGRLRVLTTYSRTNYFLDGPTPRGLTFEGVEKFVKTLNRKLGLRRRPIGVVYIPVGRDELIPRLIEGKGDLAAANLSVTEMREQHVAFGRPSITGVREVVVGGPGSEPVRSIDDLSGREIWVRRSSSFHENLATLNARFAAEGRPPVRIVAADEALETEDLLELTAAGVAPLTVADSYVAAFWADVWKTLTVYSDVTLRDDVAIAWALPQGAPQLKAEVDAFVHTHRKGTLFGNVLMKRYFERNPWVRNNLAERSLQQLEDMAYLFRRYAKRYDFDWLLVAAQAFQESGLDQSLVSPVGAVGVMQVLPSTAASHEVGIPEIEKLEHNIHAGVKYLRVLVNNYFNDPELDDVNRHLFAFAGYNAGPNRIQRLRGEAKRMGLDPNRWFENVEVVVARRVGSEPVRYVSNIFKYYVAYRTEAAAYERRQELMR